MSKAATILSKIRAFFSGIRKIPGKIRHAFLKLVRFLALIFDDLLVLAGLAVIITTNFRVHELFGWYSLGFVLIGLSLVFARWTRRKK